MGLSIFRKFLKDPVVGKGGGAPVTPEDFEYAPVPLIRRAPESSGFLLINENSEIKLDGCYN